ncbi:hypothetical protein MHK_003707 [Candidatus Magnetomorum sp. HK-1]|nr:hypothetical protein MHK_003707 [Candidatus Magnetomorum sp. HK-1]
MAKKKITGTSKLSNVDLDKKEDKTKKEKLNLVTKEKKSVRRNYIFGEKDVEALSKIVSRVNDASSRKITETSVIKGLIEIGKKSKTEKLIKAIKEAAF